jgi:hypothetical protein
MYLTMEDWAEIYKKYPGLSGMIATLSNKREKESLRKELEFKHLPQERRTWVESRLKDLCFFDEMKGE